MLDTVSDKRGLAQVTLSLRRLLGQDMATALFVAPKLPRTCGAEAFLGARLGFHFGHKSPVFCADGPGLQGLLVTTVRFPSVRSYEGSIRRDGKLEP